MRRRPRSGRPSGSQSFATVIRRNVDRLSEALSCCVPPPRDGHDPGFFRLLRDKERAPNSGLFLFSGWKPELSEGPVVATSRLTRSRGGWRDSRLSEVYLPCRPNADKTNSTAQSAFPRWVKPSFHEATAPRALRIRLARDVTAGTLISWNPKVTFWLSPQMR